MSARDRLHWDAVYSDRLRQGHEPAFPADLRAAEQYFPTKGLALDIACGRGGAAVWLARRGLDVLGVDVSPIAIDAARARASDWMVADKCRFEIVDLDDGLPSGPPVNVVICHRFRAPHLNGPVVDRLAAGGLLAISVLSEVGATSGRYRAGRGELVNAFEDLQVIASGESHGIAWLLARKP